MAQKQKDARHGDYDRNFREIFYIGILNNDNFVIDTKKFEKVRELREYVRTLLDNNQECMEKFNKIIKSNKIKDTSKIFILECQDLRLLIAMRLDVMIQPFDNIRKIDISKLERTV